MKIKVKQIKSEEQLTYSGNKFFTKEQIRDIERA